MKKTTKSICAKAYKAIALLAIPMLSIVGCQDPQKEDSPSFELTATLQNQDLLTRVALSEGVFAWEAGDQIGVSTSTQNNVCYSAVTAGETASKFTSAAEAPSEGETLYAYYPYSQGEGDVTVTVSESQVWPAENSTKVFLAGQAAVTGSKVNIPMKNLLAMLSFGLKGQGVTLASMTIAPAEEDNCSALTGSCTFNPVGGTLSEPAATGKVINLEFTGGMALTENPTYVSVSVLPFTCTAGGFVLTFTDAEGNVFEKTIWETTTDLSPDGVAGKVQVSANAHISQNIAALESDSFEEPLTGNYFLISPEDVTSSSSYDSGAERTWNYEGAQFGAVNVLKNANGALDMRGNQRGKIYNKSIFGQITQIEVTQLATDVASAEIPLYVGTTVQPNATAITPEQDGQKWTYIIPSDTPAYYFLLQAGTATASVTRIVVKYDNGPWVIASTADATDLLSADGTTATLHGSYTCGNMTAAADVVCNFEISGSPAGVTISDVTVNNDGTFSATVSGLAPGTSYSYAAVVTSGALTSKGEQKSFQTTKQTASLKVITITPSVIPGLNTSYGNYTWTMDGIELTVNNILQNAGETERFKGKKAALEVFNKTDLGKIKSIEIITDAYGANKLTVCAGADMDVTAYSQEYSPTNENITVEFENAYGFFRIKGNNQNCYIKSITITAESN
jgi:hypothetical protein